MWAPLETRSFFLDTWFPEQGLGLSYAVRPNRDYGAVIITPCSAPKACGTAISHRKAVVRHFSELSWARVVHVDFSGSIIPIGSGLAQGCEDPHGANGQRSRRCLILVPESSREGTADADLGWRGRGITRHVQCSFFWGDF